jgi:hypothetical protein
MTGTTIDYASLFRKGLPDPSPRWTGFPKYNSSAGTTTRRAFRPRR